MTRRSASPGGGLRRMFELDVGCTFIGACRRYPDALMSFISDGAAGRSRAGIASGTISRCSLGLGCVAPEDCESSIVLPKLRPALVFTGPARDVRAHASESGLILGNPTMASTGRLKLALLFRAGQVARTPDRGGGRARREVESSRCFGLLGPNAAASHRVLEYTNRFRYINAWRGRRSYEDHAAFDAVERPCRSKPALPVQRRVERCSPTLASRSTSAAGTTPGASVAIDSRAARP